jgi:E3 ubiquitin-protein ligase HERC4
LGKTTNFESSPQLVTSLKNEKIKDVFCGDSHTVIMTGILFFLKETENGIFSCGNNFYGQLGVGKTIHQNSPQPITTLKNEKVKNVACGDDHTIILTGKCPNYVKFIENGVYSFGRNCYGQLGLGTTYNETKPQLITSLKNEKVKNVFCGGSHTIILTGKV